MGPAVRAPPKSSCALKKKKPASFDETLERDDRSSLSIPPASAAAPPLAASPPASAAASSAELPPSSVSSSAPSAPASRGSGALSLEVLLLHEADDLVGDADVLDRVSTDVAVRHAPEPIAVLARADDLLEVHVHPRVAAHEVAVVRLAVLELDELIDLIRRREGERRGSGVGEGGWRGSGFRVDGEERERRGIARDAGAWTPSVTPRPRVWRDGAREGSAPRDRAIDRISFAPGGGRARTRGRIARTRGVRPGAPRTRARGFARGALPRASGGARDAADRGAVRARRSRARRLRGDAGRGRRRRTIGWPWEVFRSERGNILLDRPSASRSDRRSRGRSIDGTPTCGRSRAS